MKNTRNLFGSVLLVMTVIMTGAGLAVWKAHSVKQAIAASANHSEPVELVTTAVAQSRAWQPTATAIGTVLATRSITLSNELPGTVREVRLLAGEIVAAGTVLVGLDVSVEQAELRALEAQAALAETALQRVQRLTQDRAAPPAELERAIAERDVARAQIARTQAIIAKKTIRAPFRARVGLSDVHPGQYLNVGTELTTLQGIGHEANVDFPVAQTVAAGLRSGETVRMYAGSETAPMEAKIVAIDALIDPTTRNAKVRATVANHMNALTPGASVRVVVPTGPTAAAVAVPVSALRKGPAGDHVFVILPEKDRRGRAQLRAVISGSVLGDTILIYNGLKVGETVAASGSFKLRDGVLVAQATQTASN